MKDSEVNFPKSGAGSGSEFGQLLSKESKVALARFTLASGFAFGRSLLKEKSAPFPEFGSNDNPVIPRTRMTLAR